MTRQLLIFYWSLVVWIAYVNLKFWIDEVVDLMTCRKDCLFVKVIDNAIAMHLIVYNDNRTLHSKISHCVVLVKLTVRHSYLGKELVLLKEFIWLILINITDSMLWTNLLLNCLNEWLESCLYDLLVLNGWVSVELFLKKIL